MKPHELAGREEKAIYSRLRESRDERKIDLLSDAELSRFALLMVEGFEERSLGLLRQLARRGVRVPFLVIGRYPVYDDLNARFRPELNLLAERVGGAHTRILDMRDDSAWIHQAMSAADVPGFIVDISALSHRSMFPVLDALADEGRRVLLGYSEAKTYWPTRSEWDKLRNTLTSGERIAEMVDQKPWLFGSQHSVAPVPRHEGYGGAGRGRALIAFLPYKCARLGAVLGEDTYSRVYFVAGKPRLRSNSWRVQALKTINAPLIGNQPVITIPTFGYRRCARGMMELIFREESPVQEYDLHLALLGSKLQTLGCWIISRCLESLAVFTSTPEEYYAEAFSEGVGLSWILRCAL